MADVQFGLRVADDGEGPLVLVAGELDLSTASELRECLHDLASRHVTIDFSDVTFIDSTALGVLVAAKKRAAEDGGTLVLRGIREHQKYLFELTGLAEYMNVDGNRELTDPASPPDPA